MTRLLPEQVSEAFRATGLKPARTGENWFTEDGCGCGAAAMIRAKIPEFSNPYWPVGMAAACLGVSRLYLIGFARGFEGDRPFVPDDEHLQGHADGRAAAALVFGEEGGAP